MREDSKQHDAVNRPLHYTAGKYECLDVMRDVFGDEAVGNFCVCNAFKYVWRHKNKNGTQDLKKAAFYLNYLIEMEEKENYDGKS